MLTAVNVAKSCRMVEPKERVIFVNASPPSHDKPAALKFILAEHSQGEERPEVSPQATFFWGWGGGFVKPRLPVALWGSLLSIVTLRSNYGRNSGSY